MAAKIREKIKGSGVWWVFISQDGKRSSKRVGAKREAKKTADAINGEIALGKFNLETVKKVSVPLFRECADTWINKIAPAKCKPSTLNSYKSIYRNHLINAPFWNRPIDKITKSDCRKFLYSYVGNRSQSTILHIKDSISCCFEIAIEQDIITAAPSRGITVEATPNDLPEPYNRKQIEQLLSGAKQTKHYCFVLLLCRSACRIGEAAAMQWDDIDFKRRTWMIRRNWVQGQITTPKSKKSATIDLSRELIEALLERQKYATCEWVFPAESGRPLNTQNWRKRWWPRIINLAGLPYNRIHSLRHSAISILIESGANIKYVQKQARHASITTTVDRYGHLFDNGGSSRPVDLLDTPSAPNGAPEPEKPVPTLSLVI